MSNYKNLASTVLENSGLTTDTSITMPSTTAALFPTPPFYATIMPTNSGLANGSNSEIVEVTAATTSGANTIFSISRAQRGTSAISWDANEAILSHAIYTQDMPFIDDVLSTPSSVAYVATDNIQTSAVTTPKIADGAVTSDKIDWTTMPFTPTTKNITKVSTNIGSEGYRWCIQYDKMVVYNLNLQISTATSSNTLLYSGFPTPKLPDGTTTRATTVVANGSDNKAYRVFINQNGELWSDGVLTPGWYNGQIIYFTS